MVRGAIRSRLRRGSDRRGRWRGNRRGLDVWEEGIGWSCHEKGWMSMRSREA